MSEFISRIYVPPIKYNSKQFLQVVNRNELVVGPHLPILSEKLSTRYRKQFCILSTNASSALLLSMLAIKDKRCKVLVPAISTCLSIVNAVIAAGHEPVFCDVCPKTANIDIKAAQEIFNKEPFSIIITPNHFGISSNVKALKKFGVPIIEDAAQSALSNSYYSSEADIVILSFYPTKYLNGIDGGAILTDNYELFEKANNQIYYDRQNGFDGKIRFNFRLPNIHAFLALQSLKSLSDVSKKLELISKKYRIKAEKLKIQYLFDEINTNTLLRFNIKLNNKKERDFLLLLLKKNNIQASKELMLVANHRNFPEAIKLINTTLSIPYHLKITNQNISKIFDIIAYGLARFQS